MPLVGIPTRWCACLFPSEWASTISSTTRLACMGENNTPDASKTPRPARFRGAVLPIAALAVVLVGCFVAWSNSQNVSFGWFAYAPLSNEPFSGSGLAFVTPGTQAGLAIAVVGLLVLAFWAGYRTGTKASPREP
jgi:hypothetical protein